MKKIELANDMAITTLDADTDGYVTLTISKEGVTKGMALMNASELIELIRELKVLFLSFIED